MQQKSGRKPPKQKQEGVVPTQQDKQDGSTGQYQAWISRTQQQQQQKGKHEA
jgi:hypothetical protein